MNIRFVSALFLAGVIWAAGCGPGSAPAQTAPEPLAPPRTLSERAAVEVLDRLKQEVAARSGSPKDLNAFARNPSRIVFLVDTSQISNKDHYREFVRKFVGRLLTQMGRAQSGMPLDARHQVGLERYQLELAVPTGRGIQTTRLNPEAVQALMEKVPNKTLAMPGFTGRGHDSSGARKALLNLLGPASGSRETIVVQITSMSANADPDHPTNQAIVNIDGRSGLLEETDYVVYEDAKSSFSTDSPGNGVAPADVFVWLYGPERFAVPSGGTTGTSSGTGSSSGDSSGKGSGVGSGFVVLVLIAAGIAAVVMARQRYQVGTDGTNSAYASRVRPVRIRTSGKGEDGDHILVLPASKSVGIGPDSPLGEVYITLMGTPRVRATSPWRLVSDEVEVGSAIAQEGRKYRFVSESGKTADVPITVTRSS